MTFAYSIFEDELADPGSGMNRQRDRAGVIHLQKLVVGDPRMHETGGDVDQQTQAGEAASPLQSPANIIRECYPLHCHPHGRLTRKH